MTHQSASLVPTVAIWKDKLQFEYLISDKQEKTFDTCNASIVSNHTFLLLSFESPPSFSLCHVVLRSVEKKDDLMSTSITVSSLKSVFYFIPKNYEDTFLIEFYFFNQDLLLGCTSCTIVAKYFSYTISKFQFQSFHSLLSTNPLYLLEVTNTFADHSNALPLQHNKPMIHIELYDIPSCTLFVAFSKQESFEPWKKIATCHGKQIAFSIPFNDPQMTHLFLLCSKTSDDPNQVIQFACIELCHSLEKPVFKQKESIHWVILNLKDMILEQALWNNRNQQTTLNTNTCTYRLCVPVFDSQMITEESIYHLLSISNHSSLEYVFSKCIEYNGKYIDNISNDTFLSCQNLLIQQFPNLLQLALQYKKYDTNEQVIHNAPFLYLDRILLRIIKLLAANEKLFMKSISTLKHVQSNSLQYYVKWKYELIKQDVTMMELLKLVLAILFMNNEISFSFLLWITEILPEVIEKEENSISCLHLMILLCHVECHDDAIHWIAMKRIQSCLEAMIPGIISSSETQQLVLPAILFSTTIPPVFSFIQCVMPCFMDLFYATTIPEFTRESKIYYLVQSQSQLFSSPIQDAFKCQLYFASFQLLVDMFKNDPNEILITNLIDNYLNLLCSHDHTFAHMTLQYMSDVHSFLHYWNTICAILPYSSLVVLVPYLSRHLKSMYQYDVNTTIVMNLWVKLLRILLEYNQDQILQELLIHPWTEFVMIHNPNLLLPILLQLFTLPCSSITHLALSCIVYSNHEPCYLFDCLCCIQNQLSYQEITITKSEPIADYVDWLVSNWNDYVSIAQEWTSMTKQLQSFIQELETNSIQLYLNENNYSKLIHWWLDQSLLQESMLSLNKFIYYYQEWCTYLRNDYQVACNFVVHSCMCTSWFKQECHHLQFEQCFSKCMEKLQHQQNALDSVLLLPSTIVFDVFQELTDACRLFEHVYNHQITISLGKQIIHTLEKVAIPNTSIFEQICQIISQAHMHMAKVYQKMQETKPINYHGYTIYTNHTHSSFFIQVREGETFYRLRLKIEDKLNEQSHLVHLFPIQYEHRTCHVAYELADETVQDKFVIKKTSNEFKKPHLRAGSVYVQKIVLQDSDVELKVMEEAEMLLLLLDHVKQVLSHAIANNNATLVCMMIQDALDPSFSNVYGYQRAKQILLEYDSIFEEEMRRVRNSELLEYMKNKKIHPGLREPDMTKIFEPNPFIVQLKILIQELEPLFQSSIRIAHKEFISNPYWTRDEFEYFEICRAKNKL